MGDRGRFIMMFDPDTADGQPRSSSARIVVVHERNDGGGAYMCATFNEDPYLAGSGRDPHEATLGLATALEALAAKLRAKAPPAFEMKTAPGRECYECGGALAADEDDAHPGCMDAGAAWSDAHRGDE